MLHVIQAMREMWDIGLQALSRYRLGHAIAGKGGVGKPHVCSAAGHFPKQTTWVFLANRLWGTHVQSNLVSIDVLTFWPPTWETSTNPRSRNTASFERATKICTMWTCRSNTHRRDGVRSQKLLPKCSAARVLAAPSALALPSVKYWLWLASRPWAATLKTKTGPFLTRRDWQISDHWS